MRSLITPPTISGSCPDSSPSPRRSNTRCSTRSWRRAPRPPRSRTSPGSLPRRHRWSWARCSAYPTASAVRTPQSPCCGWASTRKVLPVFEMRGDPEALTQFIFRCRPRGVGVECCIGLSATGQRCPRKIVIRTTLVRPAAPANGGCLTRGDSRIGPKWYTAPWNNWPNWSRHDPNSGVHKEAG